MVEGFCNGIETRNPKPIQIHGNAPRVKGAIPILHWQGSSFKYAEPDWLAQKMSYDAGNGYDKKQ
jgi:hypothetical protein